MTSGQNALLLTSVILRQMLPKLTYGKRTKLSEAKGLAFTLRNMHFNVYKLSSSQISLFYLLCFIIIVRRKKMKSLCEFFSPSEV